jgi:hypothetical protein
LADRPPRWREALDALRRAGPFRFQPLITGNRKRDNAMKLTDAQVQEVLAQIDGQVVPADHPTMDQLESIFGPHTFFLGIDGLHVVECADIDGSGEEQAFVVKVAAWTDDQKTSLRPHEAELVSEVVIDADDDPAA